MSGLAARCAATCGPLALLVAIPLALAMAVVWDRGWDEFAGWDASQPVVGLAGRLAEARGWLMRDDGTLVEAWEQGPGRAFFVVPLLVTAAASSHCQ